MKKFKQQFSKSPLAGFRKKWGYSQQHLAGELQVSTSLIAMIERGERRLNANAILKLARLEIKLAAGTVPVAAAAVTATPRMQQQYQQYCNQLSRRETSCRIRAERLRVKLQRMMALYQKNNTWLQLTSLRLSEAAAGSSSWAHWKKNETKAAYSIQYCSRERQVLLLHHITSLEEEAGLYKKKLLQVQQTMVGLAVPQS